MESSVKGGLSYEYVRQMYSSQIILKAKLWEGRKGQTRDFLGSMRLKDEPNIMCM